MFGDVNIAIVSRAQLANTQVLTLNGRDGILRRSLWHAGVGPTDFAGVEERKMNYRSILRVGAALGAMSTALIAVPARAEWHQITPPGGCHQYLAFPYATGCTWAPGGGGYLIQKHVGIGGSDWVTDPNGQRAASIAVSETTGNLWAVRDDGTVLRKVGDVWSAWPLNNCGGTSTLTFDQANGVSVIAVGTNPSNNADVPWVRDAFGTVRFWRTSSSPACWAALPALPTGNVGGSIGIYKDPDVSPSNLPWVTNGGNLYQRVNNQWKLIDTATASVGGGSNLVTSVMDGSLWAYDFAWGTWDVEFTWTGPGVSRVSAGIFQGTLPWFALEAVVSNNKVWVLSGPIP